MSILPKFIYFGTPYVARDTLTVLVEQGFVPTLVITNPDAPKGRGHVLTPCETKVWALEHDLTVVTPEKLDDTAVAEIKKYACEYALVVAYGKILPESLISAFPKGVLNVHYSLLPKYRGASPVEAALLHDETVTGVTIQKMVRELDAGDILAQEEMAIGQDETTKELKPRLIEVGARLLVATLLRYLAGEIIPVPQDHARATRAPKIKKEEGKLNLSAPAFDNWRKYRAYAESPGTYFFDPPTGEGKRYKITKAKYENNSFIVERVIPEGGREIAYR